MKDFYVSFAVIGRAARRRISAPMYKTERPKKVDRKMESGDAEEK